jgi:hypothetical protein
MITIIVIDSGGIIFVLIIGEIPFGEFIPRIIDVV